MIGKHLIVSKTGVMVTVPFTSIFYISECKLATPNDGMVLPLKWWVKHKDWGLMFKYRGLVPYPQCADSYSSARRLLWQSVENYENYGQHSIELIDRVYMRLAYMTVRDIIKELHDI